MKFLFSKKLDFSFVQSAPAAESSPAFKKVVKDYETTIFAEEALHRLVEVYYKIGLVEESKKYAITLGYNYQSGEWYENSYQVFNKNYKKIRKKKQDKKSKSLIKRIKSISVNDNEL